MDWEVYGYILASRYRIRVLKSLEHGPKTPKLIEDETGVRINHVSNVLRELKEQGLATCNTPARKKGRIYVLTPKGRRYAGGVSEDRQRR